MLYKFLKSTTLKLLMLVCTVLATLIVSALLFNSQVDKLKKQIDDIYFANLIPIIKLQIISDKYQEIASCRKIKYNCDFKSEQEVILQEWEYYYNAYKTKDERIVVDTINQEIINSFKENKYNIFLDILKRVDFLIKYETQEAFKQRKAFLDDYEQMKNYIFYNIVLILFLSFAVIVFIILQVIKKDKQLTVLNKKYQIEAITDGMTQLYNRKYFDTIFDNMPFISNANNWKCAFIMVDIDYFKQYNDTYGHDMGDITLKKVAQTLKLYFNKKYEFVFRLGGEEFGVILFDINENILENCLKDMNKKILELQIEHKNSKILDVISISMGAIIYNPNSYISANKLYKFADESLYKSKENGRNQYHIYNEGK
ncbi:MAG: GGDEF domain-containing protein [Aliarcobacter sp.]|uniref:diguanylate cyclase n=1 Tax=Arcobacter aquimarinus TaxID=1315211 RepID=A0AAE7E1J3_9BACT|nr:GGDEF domain-containing protein [Arcobacter aquimarinus]QKE25972.1 diguanylate cyclase [Arcobacter aquimarinus]